MKILALCALASLVGLFALAPTVARACGCRYGCDRRHQWCGGDCPRGGPGSGNCPNWRHQPRARQFETTEGKIAEINYLPASDPGSSVLELRLAGGTSGVLVRLGPSSFLKSNNFEVREGDALSVHGYRVSSPEGEVLVATEIEKPGRRLVLRDDSGKPVWW